MSIGAINSFICLSLSVILRLILAVISWNASGSLYLSQMSSISDLTPYSPSLCARGMKIYIVSLNILSLLCSCGNHFEQKNFKKHKTKFVLGIYLQHNLHSFGSWLLIFTIWNNIEPNDWRRRNEPKQFLRSNKFVKIELCKNLLEPKSCNLRQRQFETHPVYKKN